MFEPSHPLWYRKKQLAFNVLPILTIHGLLKIGVVLNVLLFQLFFVAADYSASPPAKLQACGLQTLVPAGIAIVLLCTSARMW